MTIGFGILGMSGRGLSPKKGTPEDFNEDMQIFIAALICTAIIVLYWLATRH